MKETLKESEPKGFQTRRLLDVAEMLLIREIGSFQSNRVDVRVIAKEGEDYAHETIDYELSGRKEVYKGSVPSGKVYVEISSPSHDTRSFWAKVEDRKRMIS